MGDATAGLPFGPQSEPWCKRAFANILDEEQRSLSITAKVAANRANVDRL